MTRFQTQIILMIIYIFISIIAIISLDAQTYATSYNIASDTYKIRGVTLIPSDTMDITKIKESGFNTVFLNVENVRSVKKPYNTNYKALKQLYKNVQTLEKAKLKYVLCFASGPGYSSDFKAESLFTNKAELKYFSQMVNEVLSRYKGKPYFAGASINLANPDIDYKIYYAVQNQIIKSAQEKLGSLPFLYNLHILTFEDSLKTLPVPAMPNLVTNLQISLNALNYPGYGAGQKTSCTLDKNALLSVLEKLDGYADKYKRNTLLSIKTPWVKNSEVMLQDIFELLKMIKLDYNLSYGNSADRYDFTTNRSVVKVINRFNK